MLSNLASYLMGGAPAAVPGGPSTTTSTSSTTAPTEVAQGTVIAQQELHCIEEEDWLLVHPDDHRNYQCAPSSSSETSDDTKLSLPSCSQEGSAPISISKQRKERRRQLNGVSEEEEKSGDDGSNSNSSCCRMELQNGDSSDDEQRTKIEEDSENCAPSTGLEESWRPVKLATSPLENLLIEHPSMSVYHHSLTEDAASASLSPETIEEADQEDEPSADDEEMIEMVEQLRQRGRKTRKATASHNHNKEKQMKYQPSTSNRRQDLTVPSTATPTVPHLKGQKVTLEAAMLGGRVSQKKERTNRSQLDRLNKCRASSNQKKLRRSDRQNSNKNSFVNNNRKSSCQRSC